MKQTQTIFYITRDIERAAGYFLSTPAVHSISNNSPFAKSLKDAYPDRIFLIESDSTLDTHELLKHPETKKILENFTNPSILVFKNTPLIEKWCAENKYTLLNPAYTLASSIEEKITQLAKLRDFFELMPRYEQKTVEEISWFNEPFILQFNRSHTGSGTIHITSEAILNGLKEKFPKRECRITEFIEGPVFTSNVVVAEDTIINGNMSYQITGLDPFTDLKFATIGNDWGAPHRILNESERTAYEMMAIEIGEVLREIGWSGLFGIDAIWSTERKRWYLIEINARQPASASYESELQLKVKKDDKKITILEAHLKALCDESLKNYSLIKISDGAQIIQRVTKEITSVEQVEEVSKKLIEKNLKIIPYHNTEHNSDLLRIQSKKSIIETVGEFTEIGKEIKRILN